MPQASLFPEAGSASTWSNLFAFSFFFPFPCFLAGLVFLYETQGLCGLTLPLPKAKLPSCPKHLSWVTSAKYDKHCYWYYLVLGAGFAKIKSQA